MFMNTDQKSDLLAPPPNTNIIPGSGGHLSNPSSPNLASDIALPSPILFPKSLDSFPTNNLPQMDKTPSPPSLGPPLGRNESGHSLLTPFSSLDHSDSLFSSEKLVPGAPSPSGIGHHNSGSSLMGSPVSKLTPLTPLGTVDNSKPMLRARSHSEQRPVREQTSSNRLERHHHHHQLSVPHNNHPYQGSSLDPNSIPAVPTNANIKNPMASSPLARRVRSATSLRQNEEDSVPLKALVANKQQQLYNHHHQHQQSVPSANISLKNDDQDGNKTGSHSGDSHRRSISADNLSNSKKVSVEKWPFLFA
jgi:hypothetical protein